MRFKRSRSAAAAVVADVDAVEADVLSRCAADLLELLGEEEPAGTDPLAALVGLADGPVLAPDDPALARLLPAAYGEGDAERDAASAEFRRYTDGDLRAGKRAAAGTVLATLPHGGGKLVLDAEQAQDWLGCLNDLRLVLGTRLQVTEDLEHDAVDPDDPRRQALQVYGWLGWLQETLVEALTRGHAARRK